MTMNEYEPFALTRNNTGMSVRVMSTDDVVVAEADIYLDEGFEYYTSRASSRRDPSDSPNVEIGLKLALGRAIRQLGREILKDGQDLVREAEKKRQRQEEAAEEAKARKAQKGRPERCWCGTFNCELNPATFRL